MRRVTFRADGSFAFGGLKLRDRRFFNIYCMTIKAKIVNHLSAFECDRVWCSHGFPL